MIETTDPKDAEIERLRGELAHRKRQQVIMYSCLENIREGQNFEGCKRAADIALIAVRQITADMLENPWSKFGPNTPQT